MWEFSLIHRPVVFAHGVTEENSTLEETQYQFYAKCFLVFLEIVVPKWCLLGEGPVWDTVNRPVASIGSKKNNRKNSLWRNPSLQRIDEVKQSGTLLVYISNFYGSIAVLRREGLRSTIF